MALFDIYDLTNTAEFDYKTQQPDITFEIVENVFTEGITLEQVDTHLGIDRDSGSETKVLNEKGDFVELPEVDLSDYYTKDETPEAIDTHLGIDRTDGATDEFLNEKGEFVKVEQGGGGQGLAVYLSNTADAIIPNYKQLTYLLAAVETVLSGVVNNNEVLLGNFLYPSAIATTQISAGAWNAYFYAKASAATGVSRIRLEFFLRATNGTETVLFSKESDEINSTDYIKYDIYYSNPSVNCNLTDRLGVRVYAKTTHNANITVSTIIGDGRGAYFNSPLALRHSELRDKNAEADFQHVNQAEKDAIAKLITIPAQAGAASYNLSLNIPTLISGALPSGVNSTLVLPALAADNRNESVLHFSTGAILPTLVYSGFTPVWLNGTAISMKINKQYTIVFEQINGIVKTSWGEY